MRIGELARRALISVSRIGLLPRVPRSGNGYQSYGEGAATIVHFVSQTQGLRFSLAKSWEGMPDPSAVMPSLAKIVAALQGTEAEIDRPILAATSATKALAALLGDLRCAA